MIACIHWDLREHLHELRKDDNDPSIRRDARFYVLTNFILRANLRLRCWPSTKTICKDTGYSQPMVVEARNWLVAHQAMVIVPFDKRLGDEEKLPIRQAVYQLTGVLKLSGVIVPYIAMNPETIESVISELESIGSDVVAVKTLAAKSLAAKPKDSISIQDKPIKESAPIGTDTPLVKSSTKEPTKREPNPMFDAVAQYVFEIEPKTVTKEGGRIGILTAWLSGKSDGVKRGKKREEVGYISAPAKPEHVQMFAAYWKSVKHGADLPLDLVKFVDAWRQWATSVKINGSKRIETNGKTELHSTLMLGGMEV